MIAEEKIVLGIAIAFIALLIFLSRPKTVRPPAPPSSVADVVAPRGGIIEGRTCNSPKGTPCVEPELCPVHRRYGP